MGSGICGLSAARFLCDRGHEVSLFERFSKWHARGSSHGRSRIVRRAYPDPFYTALMADAYPMWSELQTHSSTKLLYECGLIYFGNSQSEAMITMLDGLRDLNVDFRIVTSADVHEVMPALRLVAGEIGVFTPGAGWVNAETALQTTIELALRNGAHVSFDSPVELNQLETEFDAFVVCAGSWVREFVPKLDVQVSKKTFAYFDGHLDGPVWIEDSSDNAYGFPSEPGSQTFKIGIHSWGEEIDPNNEDRTASDESIRRAAEVAKRRFVFHDPRVVEAKGCLYTSTPDEDFRWGRIGDKGFYASACSGHGFKFGPWIGKKLADFVDGVAEPESINRFSTSASSSPPLN